MPWGKIHTFNAARGEVARAKPTTGPEFEKELRDELRTRIKYNLKDDAKLRDDGAIDASDVKSIQAFLKEDKLNRTKRKQHMDFGKPRSEVWEVVGEVVLDAYKVLKKASGKSKFTYEQIIDQAVKQELKLWAGQDIKDPSTITPKEANRMLKADQALGIFAKDAVESAGFQRWSQAGGAEVDDPAVKKLKTDADFLKYNYQMVLDEDEKNLGRTVTMGQLPPKIRAAVHDESKKLEKKFAALEKDFKDDFRGGDLEVYEIYKKPGDKQIVGYLVAGRADYAYDSWTSYAVGIGLNGKKIMEDENQGP